MKKQIALLALIQAVTANATLTPSVERGEQNIVIQAEGHRAELCVIPMHMGGAEYSKKDLAQEAKLCGLVEGGNASVCAKTNSTNPGLLFFETPEGMSARDVVAKDCEVPEIDKAAKLKYSSSCSYAPALLGYYHMSRILGDIGMVPVAVLRTFDVDQQIKLLKRGFAVADKGSLIQQNIGTLMSRLGKGAAYEKRDELFTDDFTQSYGALQKNPKKEVVYKEFFNGGADRNATFAAKNQFLLKQVTDKDISQVVGREFNQANLQLMVQLKDVTDMIVLDTIMNQQDRFGNIHSENRLYYFSPDKKRADGTPKLKDDNNLKPDERVQLGALEVKRMLLKDNDCGVAKEGRIKKAGLPAKIRHLDPETYQRLIAFNAIADGEDVAKFFTRGLMFSASDWKSVRGNLKELAGQLYQRCKEGKLKLDLDLARHFSGLPLEKQSCEPQG